MVEEAEEVEARHWPSNTGGERGGWRGGDGEATEGGSGAITVTSSETSLHIPDTFGTPLCFGTNIR